MRQLPTGTVTLLFTGMEGSTRLLQQLGEGYWQKYSRDEERWPESSSFTRRRRCSIGKSAMTSG
jgi:hypothetical protein